MNEPKCPFLETRTATMSKASVAERTSAHRIPSESGPCHTAGFQLPAIGAQLRQGEPGFAARKDGKRIEFVSPVDGVVCAVNPGTHTDPEWARKDPYGKGWAFAVRPSDLARNLKMLRIGADAAAWLDREVRRFSEFLSLHRAAPAEVGVTLPDGGIHADGILETLDGEILQIVMRKFFR